jgi:acetyl-CoA carboxylase biotin carboxylase subunit
VERTTFTKVLVANRGEIAVRIIRSLKKLGIRAVAVFSEADRGCRHVEMADEARLIGPAPAAQSYLNIEAILREARSTGAEAIHPGYGFLAENPDFADACALEGLTFIGPTPENLRLAGNKLGARRAFASAGLPVIPGSTEPLTTLDSARRIARELGYPVVLKAAAGGGGRGIRRVPGERVLSEEFSIAQAEARAAFGDATVYLEKLITDARHVEVQVLGDGTGQAIHLGERNCSLQRRHQKMLEEAPSPGLSREAARPLHDAAAAAARAIRYRNAGTFEFLLDRQDRFYFMEVNARIQVEHPVTEAVTGQDLVEAQISIASEGRLPFTQEEVRFDGHAIECRINAEDPDQAFLPQPGPVERFHAPGGNGVRFDTHLYRGYVVPIYYDSLLGKLIAHGQSREEAIRIMAGALDDLEIGPIRTTGPFLRRVLEVSEFIEGTYSTGLLPTLVPGLEDD